MPQEAIRYTLSLPIATLVSGIDTMRVLRQNLAIAQGFRPITARQRDTLLRRVASTARDGRFELYKISAAFDGNEARRQHGLPLMDELTAYPLSRTAASSTPPRIVARPTPISWTRDPGYTRRAGTDRPAPDPGFSQRTRQS
jgi:hypothetical protein